MTKYIKLSLIKAKGYIQLFLILLLFVMPSSCKKLVETPPPTDQVSEINVFSTDATAIAVLNDIYVSMNEISGPFQGYKSISLLTGLSSDELGLYSGAGEFHFRYFENNLLCNDTYSSGYDLWAPLYNYIYRCNAAIIGLEASSSLSPAVKQQLLGESMFLRAFYYFYLVNLFGDIPLVLTTDAESNLLLARVSENLIYEQITADLLEAEKKLSPDYPDNTIIKKTLERVRPTSWAAKALLARVYLYTENYAQAELKSTEVINNSTLFDLPTLNNVFLKNSKEAIWQLQPTSTGYNTQDAQILIIPEYGPNYYYNMVYLSENLLTNVFEAGDLRALPGNWINNITVEGVLYKFPYKYKKFEYDPNVTSTGNMSEYFMVLRLAEQYLIRAEARAKQSNLAGSIADLDKIRQRAGLLLIANTNPGINQTTLLNKILQERRVELFTELGQRWFDLKRTGKINEVMTVVTPQKSNNVTQWRSYQQFYPISYGELQKGPNLLQTPGY